MRTIFFGAKIMAGREMRRCGPMQQFHMLGMCILTLFRLGFFGRPWTGVGGGGGVKRPPPPSVS